MSERFEHIFSNDVPLLDVRAEVEFAKGAFPTACNIPILNDRERHEVGICYRSEGPEAAEALGHSLVSGEVRRARLEAWQRFIDEHPDACLYCFRGGKRSRIAADWLSASGYQIERVPGGYKAMRGYLMSRLDELPPMIVVSGRTGVGKTELLHKLDNMLDLEAHAHHRGSAFGGHLEGQPTQIDFENRIAIALIKMAGEPVFVEDESRMIGRLTLPANVFAQMKTSPVVLLEDTLAARVDRIHQEYILERWAACRNMPGGEERALRSMSDYLHPAMAAIQKRLGGDRYRQLKGMLDDALAAQCNGNFDRHRDWIEALLEKYYDPMYNYQIERKRDLIVFSGTRQEILEWSREVRDKEAYRFR